MILHPATHLTSNYKTDEESNNYKLLTLGHLEHIEILNNLKEIEASRDIDWAADFTLDKAGKNVLEFRESRDDETFRRAIKIKIRSNLSSGTIEDINDIAGILFGEHFISVQETWDKDEYRYEPAAIYLSLTDNHTAQELFFEYIKLILMSVKAGGVRLYNRIHTEVPDAVLHVGSALVSDSLYMDVPSRTLEDINVSSTVYTGVGAFGVSYMSIPIRTLDDMNNSSTVYTGVGVFGVNYMSIPMRTLEVVEIFDIIYTGTGAYGTSFMSIPTAGLRGGD